jgi:2-methylisocitrate lyase-like PEP mutase family enzyme
MTAQLRAERFADLHRGPGVFVVPNPWDVGTARLFELMGYQALATTSSGFAFSEGRQDNPPPREEMLAHIRTIASATSLPVSADLQHGYGDDPQTVAETIRAAAEAGAVGGSIEDRPYRALNERALYPIKLAAERVRAAAEAAHTLPIRFVLTARCENYLCGNPDLDDTIRRLRAYQDAGADVLYAPGLTAPEEIRAVVASVHRPVNFVAGLAGEPFSIAELESFGVRRISLGSTLARVAFGSLIAAAEEMREHGTFGFVSSAIPYARIDELFAVQPQPGGQRTARQCRTVRPSTRPT